jgi:hypothetical protein
MNSSHIALNSIDNYHLSIIQENNWGQPSNNKYKISRMGKPNMNSTAKASSMHQSIRQRNHKVLPLQ